MQTSVSDQQVNTPQPSLSSKNNLLPILAVIILVCITAVVSYTLGANSQKNNFIANNLQTKTLETPTIPPVTITTVPSQTVAIFEKNKLYVQKHVDNSSVNLYTQLPPGSQIISMKDNQGYVYAEVLMNGSSFAFATQGGGRGGPCPNIENGPTHCTYTDEEITSPTVIAALRVWKDDKRGVFLLNPQSLRIKGNYDINSILLSKLNPSETFTEEEVTAWKNIFSKITVEGN